MTHFEINSPVFPEKRYRKQESLLFFQSVQLPVFSERTESWNTCRAREEARIILGGWGIEVMAVSLSPPPPHSWTIVLWPQD